MAKGLLAAAGEKAEQQKTFVDEENPDEEYELSEEAQAELDAFTDNASIVIHGEQSRDKILSLLQQGDKIEAVANATLLIFKQMEASAQKGGKQFNEITMLYGAAFIVSELVEIGDAAGIFQFSEEEMQAAMQKAMQQYIHEGLRNGRIDPIGLQKELEPLMAEVAPNEFNQAQQIAKQQGFYGGGGNEQ